MTIRVGFIGLGNIGRPLASRLVPAGFETWVYDLADDPVRALVEAGAKGAGSPRQVAEHADVLGICVPEDDDVRAVLRGEDGVLAGAAPGSVVAVHSTVLPRTVVELGQEAAACGVSLIDACVTGGDQRAAEGTVTYLVGGEDAAVEKARPFLEAASERILRAGPLGSGAKLKLAINVLTYIQWAAAQESHSLALASGLSSEIFEQAGRANGQLSELQVRYLTTWKLPEQARTSEGFQRLVRGHMHTAEKDLAWALQLAREAGISLPVTGLVSQQMARIYAVEDEKRR